MSRPRQLLRSLAKRAVPSQGLRVELRALAEQVARVRALVVARVSKHGRLADVRGRALLLNFGCGALHGPAWINVDLDARSGAYVADLRDPLPLADGSAAHIHCEHFLEHLDYFYARRFLAECHRVLEPGAIMRIVVPDAGKYMRAYAQGDRAFFHALRDLGGAPEPFRTPVEIVNQMFRMGGAHAFAWDLETLRLAASEAGFTRVEDSRRGAMPTRFDIDGTDPWREVESLYCNAIK